MPILGLDPDLPRYAKLVCLDAGVRVALVFDGSVDPSNSGRSQCPMGRDTGKFCIWCSCYCADR